MALMVGVSTSVSAQNESVPNTTTNVTSEFAGITPASPFYFLDRLGEMIQELFTFNPQAKIELKVKFAKERIAEIKIMLDEEKPDEDGIKEAQSLFVEDIEDAKNMADEENIDNSDISEATDILNEEIDTEDNDTRQTFEEIKNQIDDEEDTIGAGDIADELDNEEKIDDNKKQEIRKDEPKENEEYDYTKERSEDN